MIRLRKNTTVDEDTITNENTTTNDDNEPYVPKCIEKWDDLPTKVDILRGIYAYGFEKPSPIQKNAILSMFDKKDIIGQAQSGTGKTGCFVIAALHTVDQTSQSTQVLILSPTRELSMQTKQVIDAIGSQCVDIHSMLLIGGTSTDKDIHTLRHKAPHIVIGCPGRVYEMLRRRRLGTKNIETNYFR